MINKISGIDLKKISIIFFIGLVELFFGRSLGAFPLFGIIAFGFLVIIIVAIVNPENIYYLFIFQIILVPQWVDQYLPVGGRIGYLALFIFLLTFLTMITKSNLKFKFYYYDFFIFIFLILAYVRSYDVLNKDISTQFFKLLIIPIFFYFLIRIIGFRKEQISKIFDLLIISGMISVGVMIFEFIFLSKPLFSIPGYSYYWTEGATFRPGGTLGAAPNMGVVLSMILPLSIAKVMQKKVSVFYRLSPVIMSLGIFLSFTRAPWLGALIGVTVFVLISTQFRRWLVISIVAGLLIYFFYFNYVQEILPISNVLYRQTMSSRLSVWSTAVDLLSSSPLVFIFGKGYWHSQALSGVGIVGSLSLHNDYLSILVDFGIVGLLSYILWILSVCYRAFRSMDLGKIEVSSLLAAIIAFITAGFFGSFLQYSININLLFFLLAALLSHYYSEKIHSSVKQ